MSQQENRLKSLLENTANHEAELVAFVEDVLAHEGLRSCSRETWTQYLAITRQADFLTALPDDQARLNWAETTFSIVEGISFNLGDLFQQRVASHPDRTLFQELGEPGSGRWSYAQILRQVRSMAAVFLSDGLQEQPAGAQHGEVRLALLCENSIDTACADLACLTNDIFVTPLNVHFSVENLVWIFDRLQITAAVCDHPDRLEHLLSIRAKSRIYFKIFTLNDCRRVGKDNILRMAECQAQLDVVTVDEILKNRPQRTMRESTTVMFTSGSTGRPKGISFNQYNLVTKRFARAAALPEVGRDETMLCYLPLFHTFGRYLEMLGTIFWGGTYVFSGNPSADTLMAQFQEVRPTALISVPVRWVQIREKVMTICGEDGETRSQEEVFREIVGDRFYWGLSAAGYLDPKVFRFYHRLGVSLCSGFGMTEGTGGLTMTPPDDYVEGSVGVPLPGVAVRFGDEGELQIAGPYIARYLPEDGPSGSLQVEDEGSDEFWLATGDLFRKTHGRHLEIVDRIKDIYKNNRGQTIAPRKIEALFEGVPGIKRTFLAGDGRSYNTLLIVPDNDDEVIRSLGGQEEKREYFQQLVTTANPGLAPFERVVNFSILVRDFSLDKEELTAKGSYRRKTIEKNFAETISELYVSNVIELEIGEISIAIPRWFFRDLGVLEDAITVQDNVLFNRENKTSLTVEKHDADLILIGDLLYHMDGSQVDLGLLARNPKLWMGNPGLTEFCPCKPGLDSSLGPFSEQVKLPDREMEEHVNVTTRSVVDRQLAQVDILLRQALFQGHSEALAAIVELDVELSHVGARQGAVIRRRLEALSNHPVKEVRCRAYQVLVLDQPVPDYLQYLPAFIESGKTFLDEESFQAISRPSIEPRRLQALRQRLHTYREQLAWPTTPKSREVFTDLFRLFSDFGRYHPEFYSSIREELVSWIMHTSDPELSAAAHKEFSVLAAWFEARLKSGNVAMDPKEWQGKIVFQEGLSPLEVDRLKQVLVGTTFLKQSIMLAFEGEELFMQEIGKGGIWVSRIISRFEDSRYRVSINTRTGKHFDLQLIIRQDSDLVTMQETIFFYIMLRGYPFGTPMLPSFGCCRPEMGALSMAYVSDLTVWEKIREFSSVRGPGTSLPSRMRWHQLMVRAMSVVIRGWRNSGKRIIPGLITPNNIVVPEPDFRKGAVQNNLSGWKKYDGPLSLIRPLWRNMYQHTISHYPWTKEYLDRAWIFEAMTESLGVEEALAWMKELRDDSTDLQMDELGLGFNETLNSFISDLENKYYQPLPLKAAIQRFTEWERVNSGAGSKGRLGILEELTRLYRLDRMSEIARFTLFRYTFFKNAELHSLDIFDRLLIRMYRHPKRRSTQMVELPDLQAAITDPDDRIAFNRLVFPLRRRSEKMELQAVGEGEQSQVIVRSIIKDKPGRSYTMAEPVGPADVGQLYALFLNAGFPKNITESDRFYVASDEAEQIIGGVMYRVISDSVIFLDGIVVTQALTDRGIASAILADFCTRMTTRHFKYVKTHFFLRHFFQQHGFRIDERWGGLVRFL